MKKLIVSLSILASSVGFAQSNQEIITNIANNVITQTYIDLAHAAQDLSVAVDQFAANPTEENLANAQQAWRRTRVFWESSEAFLFGPVDALGIDPMLDTWPLNRMDLESVMKSNSSITVETVRALGTNLQGFHTIEYILFGDGLAVNNKNLNQFNSKQLQYASASAALLAEYTATLANAWTTNYDPENPTAPGYASIIGNPSANNPLYSSERAVLEEYVQGMLGILDEVGNGKIADPFGADAASADVELVESPYSWNSLADFNNNIRSVYNIYTGNNGAHNGPGIQDYIAKKNPALAAKVEAEIIATMQAIVDISGPQRDMPFRRAIKDAQGRLRIEAAIAKLAETRALIENEVLPLLD